MKFSLLRCYFDCYVPFVEVPSQLVSVEPVQDYGLIDRHVSFVVHDEDVPDDVLQAQFLVPGPIGDVGVNVELIAGVDDRIYFLPSPVADGYNVVGYKSDDTDRDVLEPSTFFLVAGGGEAAGAAKDGLQLGNLEICVSPLPESFLGVLLLLMDRRL